MRRAGFFFSMAPLAPVDGDAGKIDPSRLERRSPASRRTPCITAAPMAVTMTQATEIGTVYSLDEIDAIAAIAKATTCLCTWMAPALPMRWSHSTPARPK
jgi:threonine aldolase